MGDVCLPTSHLWKNPPKPLIQRKGYRIISLLCERGREDLLFLTPSWDCSSSRHHLPASSSFYDSFRADGWLTVVGSKCSYRAIVSEISVEHEEVGCSPLFVNKFFCYLLKRFDALYSHALLHREAINQSYSSCSSHWGGKLVVVVCWQQNRVLSKLKGVSLLKCNKMQAERKKKEKHFPCTQTNLPTTMMTR